MSRIRLEKLKKSFGPKQVLDGLDLEIGPGEIVFVIGKSGTGKSVLLKHIVGLMQPDSGKSISMASPWVAKTKASGTAFANSAGWFFSTQRFSIR